MADMKMYQRQAQLSSCLKSK